MSRIYSDSYQARWKREQRAKLKAEQDKNKVAEALDRRASTAPYTHESHGAASSGSGAALVLIILVISGVLAWVFFKDEIKELLGLDDGANEEQ